VIPTLLFDKSRLRKKTHSNALILFLVFGLLCSVSVAAHLGRVIHKGSNYELAEYQDGVYYFAMVKNLFETPKSLIEELRDFPELDSVANATQEYYGKNPNQWHLENGLSHSPPYAYRILQPAIVKFLSFLGLDPKLGFLVISSFGFGLMGIFLYLLLRNSRVSASSRIIMLLCFTIAGVSLIANPIYTDSLFMGLLVTCIFLQKNGYLKSALFLSSIAVLNRETSLLIWLYLVIIVLLESKRNTRHLRKYFAFITLAPLAFVLPRLKILVPNKEYPLADLIVAFWQSDRVLPFLGLLVILIGCSSIPFLFITKQFSQITQEDFLLFSLGLMGFFISCSLGANWERFLLTSWPMFLLYDSLEKTSYRNRFVLLNALGLLFLGLNDYLIFNSDLNKTNLQLIEILILLGANCAIILHHAIKIPHS